MSVYEDVVVRIVEKGTVKNVISDKIEKKGTDLELEELNQLWWEIEIVCKSIIDDSVGLLHQNPSSMVEILISNL